jgi:hypothetical protein
MSDHDTLDEEADLVHRLAARAWKLHTHLEYAGVPQEDQDLLFIEITAAEARSFLLIAHHVGHLDARFLFKDPNDRDGSGFDWHKTVHLTHSMPKGLSMPERGKVWTEMYGLKLVWIGN